MLTCAQPSHVMPWSTSAAAAPTRLPVPVPRTVCEYAEPNELRLGRPFAVVLSPCAYAASRPVHNFIAIWLVFWRSAVDMGWGICRTCQNFVLDGLILQPITFIIMCEETCPPSAESRLPGRPAASQLEQMSTFSHIAQWKRAPTISCMQLEPSISPIAGTMVSILLTAHNVLRRVS